MKASVKRKSLQREVNVHQVSSANRLSVSEKSNRSSQISVLTSSVRRKPVSPLSSPSQKIIGVSVQHFLVVGFVLSIFIFGFGVFSHRVSQDLDRTRKQLTRSQSYTFHAIRESANSEFNLVINDHSENRVIEEDSAAIIGGLRKVDQSDSDVERSLESKLIHLNGHSKIKQRKDSTQYLNLKESGLRIPIRKQRGKTIHVVFSSSCSESQHWQSEVLLHSWFATMGGTDSQSVWVDPNQPGNRHFKYTITRIIGGCDDSDSKERLTRTSLPTELIGQAVHFHFTPDFTPKKSSMGGGRFTYLNKPFGMFHWLKYSSISQLCRDQTIQSTDVEKDPKHLFRRIWEREVDMDQHSSDPFSMFWEGNLTLEVKRALRKNAIPDFNQDFAEWTSWMARMMGGEWCSIVLIDPDMIITHSFDDISRFLHTHLDPEHSKQVGGSEVDSHFEERVSHNQDLVKYLSTRRVSEARDAAVQRGGPVDDNLVLPSAIAAKYGIGDRWSKWPLCPTMNDCDHTSKSQRRLIEFYAVGPPYILTFAQWRALTPLWVRFSPIILGQYERWPSNMAEMYGYSLSCAMLGFRHLRVSSLMVSDTSGHSNSDEGWKRLDIAGFRELTTYDHPSSLDHSQIRDLVIADSVKAKAVYSSDYLGSSNGGWFDESTRLVLATQARFFGEVNVMHHCQMYYICSLKKRKPGRQGQSKCPHKQSSPRMGGFKFHKYLLNSNLLYECPPLISEMDPSLITADQITSGMLLYPGLTGKNAWITDEVEKGKNIFMIHFVIANVNLAFRKYREKYCENGNEHHHQRYGWLMQEYDRNAANIGFFLSDSGVYQNKMTEDERWVYNDTELGLGWMTYIPSHSLLYRPQMKKFEQMKIMETQPP